jgi:hypothetical protein
MEWKIDEDQLTLIFEEKKDGSVFRKKASATK